MVAMLISLAAANSLRSNVNKGALDHITEEAKIKAFFPI